MTVVELVLQATEFERVNGSWPKRLTLNPVNAKEIMDDVPLALLLEWTFKHEPPPPHSLRGMDWYQDEIVPVGEAHFAL